MTSDAETETRQQAARLLDQVMRGKRAVLFPPGTVAASLLVPAFAVGAAALATGVAVRVSDSPNAIPAAALLGTAMVTVAMAGQVFIVRGRSRHRIWMRAFARALLGCTIAAALIGLVNHVSVPWILGIGAIGAFAVCEVILGSRAYLAFASFMSLKRQYREDQLAARARVLGRHAGKLDEGRGRDGIGQ
ncbi:MAG TPA: hypothetical protein VNO55_30940 [Polyangia bacterium]|nr:hypothetical protein [Polyangia bacterium]